MLEKRVTRQVWPVAFVVVSVIAVALLTLFSSAADSIGVGDFTPTVFAYLPLVAKAPEPTSTATPRPALLDGYYEANVSQWNNNYMGEIWFTVTGGQPKDGGYSFRHKDSSCGGWWREYQWQGPPTNGIFTWYVSYPDPGETLPKQMLNCQILSSTEAGCNVMSEPLLDPWDGLCSTANGTAKRQ